ncbi:uncharacterized protein LOC121392602 [Gigantopelta aegis]|uniref:uncharacterized protein LOC121392602 n=1 Tax=Gigantopelta aegis TaxID=1735272 RepID=UPI001B88B985|nr:uncharacterized protein LOC121392602 [Gigantopelta aegis]
MLVFHAVIVVFLGALVQAEFPCEANKPGQNWVADPRDCSKFYLCFAGKKYDFDCGKSVWDPDTKTCVGRGSRWDKCSIKTELEKLNPCYEGGNGMTAKSDNCAQYFDCRSRETTISQDPHLKECPYPLLYNEDEKRCEPHTSVECGKRKEPVDPCEYEANQCKFAHCVPCNVRFSSCNALPDGLNPWVGREWSPFFVVCQKNRVVYNGQCDMTNGLQMFSPIKKMCVDADFKKDME